MVFVGKTKESVIQKILVFVFNKTHHQAIASKVVLLENLALVDWEFVENYRREVVLVSMEQQLAISHAEMPSSLGNIIRRETAKQDFNAFRLSLALR